MIKEVSIEKEVGIPELLLRKVNRRYKHIIKVTSPESAAKLFKKVVGDYCNYKEMVVAIYFDRANIPIGHSIVGLGTMSSCTLDVQDICRIAILSGAQGVILGHNHPTGTLKASDSDRNVTRKVKNALNLFDITLLDHIIFRDEDSEYYSFEDKCEL